MNKRIYFITILFTLLLTACQGASPTTTEEPSLVESAPTATKADPTQVPATEAKSSPQATASEVDTFTGSSPPGCTVVSPITGPEPTQDSPFPPVSEDDWVVGPEDAAITFIEYGDFQ
jgi:hypothetical protein